MKHRARSTQTDSERQWRPGRDRSARELRLRLGLRPKLQRMRPGQRIESNYSPNPLLPGSHNRHSTRGAHA
eukprot:2456326-Rhodomonas_salina.6